MIVGAAIGAGSMLGVNYIPAAEMPPPVVYGREDRHNLKSPTPMWFGEIEAVQTNDLTPTLTLDTQSYEVSITTLEPEPFVLLHEIPVAVFSDEDGYLATFTDADISMTGDTREEAMENLRLLIVDMFDDLDAQEAQLGPFPQRQLSVLRKFIHRRS